MTEEEKKEHRKKYLAYITSEGWYQLKSDLISKRGCNCEECGKKRKLDLHHITYKRLFNELPQDLKLLCRSCHEIVHDIIKTKRERKKERKSVTKPITSELKILRIKKKITHLNKRLEKLHIKHKKGFYSYDTLCANRSMIVNRIAHLKKMIII